MFLFVPIILLTILYSVNLFFLNKKELLAIWKNVTLFLNIFALICSVPTVYLTWIIMSLNEMMGSGQGEITILVVIVEIIYCFVVNIILSVLLIKKKTISGHEVKTSSDVDENKNKNKKFKVLSFIFLYATMALLVFRSLYADDGEVLFIKGNLESVIYAFYFIAFVYTVVVTALIISIKKKEILLITTIILGIIFAIMMILNIIIKPNDFAALSGKEKEVFLDLSIEYLEEVYPEGVETSNVKYSRSELGGNFIHINFNYDIKDCQTNDCGPYEFDANYQMKTGSLIDVTDSGQNLSSDGQTYDTEENGNVSFVVEQRESIIQKEEKSIFVEKGKENELKEKVMSLIEEGYAFSTNNGLPTHPNNHYDRLRFTEYKKSEYEKLLSIDANEFYEYIKVESDHYQSEETDFVLYPLGRDSGKIIIEVSPDGYMVKGLPFKTVDTRKRIVFDLGNGETFTGVVESDHHFRKDRAWISIEDKGTSKYNNGEFIQVKF